jgi:type III restriction enzyme
MKLKFKQQEFQINAVKAIVDVFDGQPLKSNKFTLEKSNALIQKAKNAAQGLQTLDFEQNVFEQIGYRNSEIKITDNQILENIKAVQQRNEIKEITNIETPTVKIGVNLTIEMETGTGKTYTYIRTMYELNKKYGWSKYIIIVPSIAIREGVYKSFEVMKEHFQEMYGQQIAPFIYNSKRPQDIENFASDSRISVMIINTQAFAAKGKDARRIYQELDQFGSRKPIEIIAQTRPILIIDEPQSVEGKQTVKSMESFNPLLTLRYSATHKTEYNKVFRLDALDAYNRKLVKKIQVKGISLKGSTGTSGYLYLQNINLSKGNPTATVELEQRTASNKIRKITKKLAKGANLFELSGEMPAYKNQTITDVTANKIIINGQDILEGEILNHEDEAIFRRLQIRECIASHLEKEKQLFAKGIKVLSLFFIDSVDKYRKYDEATGEAIKGEYAQIFEEEYNKQRSTYLDLFEVEYNDYLREADPENAAKGYFITNYNNYKEYINGIEAAKVHNGYFSIDKKGKIIDSKIKRGKESSDDVSAYDLIMKDKERLLSFEEPTRFIFSHSALKEGWDNPNVFQICALKNADSGSTTRRRQEVGRGMRLCVNKEGIRQDFQTVGDAVHDLNKLTVIASESYESFAKGLQSEIAATLKDRPTKVTMDFLSNKILVNEKGEKYRITERDANTLHRLLDRQGIIDLDDQITTEGRERIEMDDIPIPDSLKPFKTQVVKLLKSVYTKDAFKIEDGRKTQTIKPNKNFHKEAFKALWQKINTKSIYRVAYNTPELIKTCKTKLDAELKVGNRRYEVRTGVMERTSLEELQAKAAFRDEHRKTEKLGQTYTETVYDVIGEMEAKTHLTRRTIVDILTGIQPTTFALLQKNPEVFIAKATELINEVKASLILDNITYYKTDETYDRTLVFSNDVSVMRQEEKLKKHIYDYITTDSDVEQKFVTALETANEIHIYAKLPKDFFIPTPVGRFSPDWAIVLNEANVKHIYFVVETKGSDSPQDLREIEKLKIHCASEHFKGISNNEVKFGVATDYDTLQNIFAKHNG